MALSKDLVLIFDRQDGSQVFFKTEAGLEICLPQSLVSDIDYKNKKVYLSLDDQPQGVRSQKEALNELLTEE